MEKKRLRDLRHSGGRLPDRVLCTEKLTFARSHAEEKSEREERKAATAAACDACDTKIHPQQWGRAGAKIKDCL